MNLGRGRLHHEGFASISVVMAKGRPIGAQALSTLVMETSEGLVDIPYADIETSIQAWGSRRTQTTNRTQTTTAGTTYALNLLWWRRGETTTDCLWMRYARAN